MRFPRRMGWAVVLLAVAGVFLATPPARLWRTRLAVLKVRGSLPSVSWKTLLIHIGLLPATTSSGALAPTRERIRPGDYNDAVEAEHLARYQFAKSYSAGKTVADIACGTGYGMEILRQVAARVDGYDREQLANNYIIDLDKESWNRPYDVVVSFETIEHLERPEFFLRNVSTTAPLLIISTPIGETDGVNPFHKQSWTLPGIKALLANFFTCEYHYQFGEIIHPDPQLPFYYLVGVCRSKTALPPSR